MWRSGAGNVQYTLADDTLIPMLHATMRKRDREELTAASGPDLVDQLHRSIRLSIAPGAAFSPTGELLCLFGAVPLTMLADTAIPWLVGTDALGRYPSALERGARGYLAAVQQQYPRLVNYVDARNLPSLRWLARVGFSIDPALPFGYEKRPFHRFHKGFDYDV
jgi:hypothetical protein